MSKDTSSGGEQAASSSVPFSGMGQPGSAPASSGTVKYEPPPANSPPPPPRRIVKAEEPPPPEPLHPGQWVGKCQIEALIGYGGMGAVYRARHTGLNLPVALKIMLPQANNHDQVENAKRFVREASLTLDIHHPNLIQVLEASKDEATGLDYIVQEFIDGGTVAELLKAGPLTEAKTLDIAIGVASALAAVGEHNIVHRDIKPENIMLTRQGEVKLADLGIAKDCCGRDEGLTMSRVMMGSPDYIAPEQARNTKRVDARADIYGLGASCYHMLCGQMPYPGKGTYDVITKLINDPVPDPRQKRPEISRPLADLVMWMMAKKPEHRPATAQVLLVELQEVRQGKTGSARRQLRKNASQGFWNNPLALGATVGALLLLILIGVLLLVLKH
jgi:serine/threonine-protein kinase